MASGYCTPLAHDAALSFQLGTMQEELQGTQAEATSLRGRYSSCQREAMELQQRVLEQEKKNAELQREHRGTLESLHRAREQVSARTPPLNSIMYTAMLLKQ